MSNYADDLDDRGVASGLPTGFTSRWATGATWSTIDTGGGNIALRRVHTSNVRSFASLDAIDSDADRDDVEVLVRFSGSAFGTSTSGVVLRGSGSAGAETGYVAMTTTGGDVRFTRYVSGTLTTIATDTSANLDASTYYWMRARVSGTSYAITYWSGAEGDDPGTPQLSGTDSNISGVGWAGVFAFNGVSANYDWSDIAIATNGDVATMAVGATNLTVADALHAHAADNVVLTSATAITIADALHAHAADNVVLTSATAITIADALHAHAADNVVLTSATAITIADALHAHAADNVVLEVSGTANLTVADALHAHAADNLVLTSQIAIVVADALHAHTADGLTLTAASVLALQDALHAHAADNLTLELSGGITLTLADALHAHTADGVLLTVSAYLVVSDALHAHTADNILLSIPGAFRAGNPRVWILDSRQRHSMVDSRRRVVHLN